MVVSDREIKDMSKKFYVFRHGETELNRQKRWQGSGMDYELNSDGCRQAGELAQKLAGKNLEIIFSSPLKRALQTAEAVAAVIDIPVIVKEDLRECFYGEAEGQLIADLKKNVPEIVNNWVHPDFWDIRFAGGESKKEALERVLSVFDELCQEKYAIMGVAIHGGTMAALLNHFGYAFTQIANCAFFCLLYENGYWRVDGELF